MTTTASAISKFIDTFPVKSLHQLELSKAIKDICCSQPFEELLSTLIAAPAFSAELGTEFAAVNAVSGISACRSLRSSLNFSLGRFFGLLSELVTAFDHSTGEQWQAIANRLYPTELGEYKLLTYLTNSDLTNSTVASVYTALAARLIQQNPHAIYPTSSYRESHGTVESTPDDQTIEAVMRHSTFTAMKIVDHTLDVDQLLLRDTYISLGRCVCLVDQNVEQYYSQQIDQYFAHHDIALEKVVYRAMEVDKGIATVERMLGDFKALGVSRNEPVLIIGGGVLADTAGLACALYHRNTPYIILSTSIVAGIDAGPSPRTCCDGFGYKNLFGAYHPPILSITDRYFFKTLREGWLRHGIVEIIKMAVVKDADLFVNLEKATDQLITTRFGTIDCEPTDEINALSQKILGGALRSYVAAEYNNLYETHQCRPHAYGHTWSPGFEIEAGLLHGHAVSIGMGFGAYLSYRMDWISKADCHRILNLINAFGLSLWHDILYNKETLWLSHQKIVQKRGQNLVAPLPKGTIGECAYLNSLSQLELYTAIDDYELLCKDFPRGGHGIDPHCHDVGLEDPSTVGQGAAGQGEPKVSSLDNLDSAKADSSNMSSREVFSTV